MNHKTNEGSDLADDTRTILFVDDDPNIHRLLAKIAEKFQFKLIEAFNGAEALKILQEKPVDLVLLDIMMPQMDGRDVCKAIKNSEKTKDIPVVIFSAKDHQSDRLLGFELGADDYITKPFNLEVLMRKIEYFLEERKVS
jgi:two-component system alkaline phosphatase synthesis response regulator PhoP